MQRTLLAGLLGLVVLVAAARGQAMMMAPPVISQRVAASDAVVVGKVTGFADKAATAVRFPGGTDKVNYQVALVKVEEALLAPKDAKVLRVGFLPPAPPAPSPVSPAAPVVPMLLEPAVP